MVTIIDYGIGNLRSIEKAFQAVGAEVLRTDKAEDLQRAERLVLPGVGAFGACAAEIRRRDLVEPIVDAVAAGIPLLGVCVGMQLLFETGEEKGLHKGLGLLPGRVRRFDFEEEEEGASCESPARPATGIVNSRQLKVPHMGWNTLLPTRPSPLLAGLDDGAYVYFVHSYYAEPAQESDALAYTEYGVRFTSVVARNNVFGVQFHPEKSQQVGLRVLHNFSRLPA